LVYYIPNTNKIVLTILTKLRSPNYLFTLRTAINIAKYRLFNILNRTLFVDFTMRKVVPISAIAPKEYFIIAIRVTILVRLYVVVISTLLTLLLRTK
jgi:hypothetical protein